MAKSSLVKTSPEIHIAFGNAVEELQNDWSVECPICERLFENKNPFDPEFIIKCDCGTQFKTQRIYFENGSYLK